MFVFILKVLVGLAVLTQTRETLNFGGMTATSNSSNVRLQKMVVWKFYMWNPNENFRSEALI